MNLFTLTGRGHSHLSNGSHGQPSNDSPWPTGPQSCVWLTQFFAATCGLQWHMSQMIHRWELLLFGGWPLLAGPPLVDGHVWSVWYSQEAVFIFFFSHLIYSWAHWANIAFRDSIDLYFHTTLLLLHNQLCDVLLLENQQPDLLFK